MSVSLIYGANISTGGFVSLLKLCNKSLPARRLMMAAGLWSINVN